MDFLILIRFEHTLFALPYAVTAALLAARGLPSWSTGFWILIALVAARTAAMTFNRLVDRTYDRQNARTARRLSATGAISATFMSLATVASSAVFVGAAWKLNPLAFSLSLPTLVVLLGYSLTKRLFAYTHFVLGLALALSPLGAWVAVDGALGIKDWPVFMLSGAVFFWTAGFDMLYACQDREFDQSIGLRSVPQKFGVAGALVFAKSCHFLVPILLVLAGYGFGLTWLWYVMVVLVAGLLVYEHSLVRVDDLRRVDRAFFQVNVLIACAVVLGAISEVFIMESMR